MWVKIKEKLRGDVELTELIINSGAAFGIKLMGVLFSYVFTFLVARFYGANALGIFSICLSSINIATIVSKLGLNTILLRLTAKYKALAQNHNIIETYQRVFALISFSSLMVTLIVCVYSDRIAIRVFDKPYLSESLKLVGLSVFPFTWMYINIEGLRGIKRVYLFSFFESLWPQLGATITLVLLFWFYPSNGENVPYLAYSIPATIAAVSSFMVLNNNISVASFSRLTLKWFGQGSKFKSLLKSSMPLLLASSLQLVMNTTDTLMLGAMQSDSEVGIFNVCVKITNITTIGLLAVNSIVAPKFAEEWGRNNLVGLQKVARQATALTFWSSLPFFVGIFLVPEFILNLFGQEFIEGKAAILIIALGQCVNIGCGSVGYILQMTEHENAFKNIILISGILNVILNFFLIPSYSYFGAALASLVATCFWNIAMSFYLKNKLGISVSIISYKFD
ncbi:Membrane protein involved in the export of O-antigen and teichoic acid [Catalinimonas alkaloidigena]|uniref:Membrane protein involved in the export of O-antigen and teichoic acid n=1 Tax=Catalinimonas alkaloidigena TaxID=1075417 RepID=A0A1G9J3G8_9BACT|nr:flippase [Catalinimonas alkaloidigena]SDL32058.1 Membrane protein involved in the export of O-antigen and teichoic acid [Catalinimonas alkaloidigena]